MPRKQKQVLYMIKFENENGDTTAFPSPLIAALELMTNKTDRVRIMSAGHIYVLTKGESTAGMFLREKYTDARIVRPFPVTVTIDGWTIKKFLISGVHAPRFSLEWNQAKFEYKSSTMDLFGENLLFFEYRVIPPEVSVTLQKLRDVSPKIETVVVTANGHRISRTRVVGSLFQVTVETGNLASTHHIDVGPPSDELAEVFDAINTK